MQAQEAVRRQPKVERNMDLIRDLLLTIEQNPEMDYTRQFPINHPALDVPGYSPDQLAYHAKLLLENDYVKGDYRGPMISGLTSAGHDFLDNIRDAGIWHTTKRQLAGLPSVSLKVFAAIAETVIKKHLGLQ
jgi:hypothetical protein